MDATAAREERPHLLRQSLLLVFGDLSFSRDSSLFHVIREVDHHDEIDVTEHRHVLAAVQRHLVVDDLTLLVEDDVTDLTDEQTPRAARLPVLR